jgi:hypothetical protein
LERPERMLGQYRDRQFESLRSLLFESIMNIAADIHTDGTLYGQVASVMTGAGKTMHKSLGKGDECS